MSESVVAQGVSFNKLGNAISDAIHDALSRGMAMDEAVCVVVAVAADYARGEYGASYLPSLAEVVIERGSHPMPDEHSASTAASQNYEA
jgi:hypothetical protein